MNREQKNNGKPFHLGRAIKGIVEEVTNKKTADKLHDAFNSLNHRSSNSNEDEATNSQTIEKQFQPFSGKGYTTSNSAIAKSQSFNNSDDDLINIASNNEDKELEMALERSLQDLEYTNSISTNSIKNDELSEEEQLELALSFSKMSNITTETNDHVTTIQNNFLDNNYVDEETELQLALAISENDIYDSINNNENSIGSQENNTNTTTVSSNNTPLLYSKLLDAARNCESSENQKIILKVFSSQSIPLEWSKEIYYKVINNFNPETQSFKTQLTKIFNINSKDLTTDSEVLELPSCFDLTKEWHAPGNHNHQFSNMKVSGEYNDSDSDIEILS